jgi:hypothetical protein
MIKLIGYNDKQLINIFRKTKIYMDFGYHPGKDRMPREAVLFDNCIITNQKGSALNNLDIPIKNRYKFKEVQSNIPEIKKLIKKILNEYKNEIKNFKTYQKIVLREKFKFEKDLRNIFVRF